MKRVFKPISLAEYVDKFLKANPTEIRAEVLGRLQDAIAAHLRGVRCDCGEPIWIIGSAESGYACFTCITGEAKPDNDYEISTER